MEWTGREIKRRRIARGLGQADLAELTGISRSAITKWETNERQPGAASIRKLQRVLGDDADLRREVTLSEATDMDLLTELLNRLSRHQPGAEGDVQLSGDPLRWDTGDRPAARRKRGKPDETFDNPGARPHTGV